MPRRSKRLQARQGPPEAQPAPQFTNDELPPVLAAVDLVPAAAQPEPSNEPGKQMVSVHATLEEFRPLKDNPESFLALARSLGILTEDVGPAMEYLLNFKERAEIEVGTYEARIKVHVTRKEQEIDFLVNLDRESGQEAEQGNGQQEIDFHVNLDQESGQEAEAEEDSGQQATEGSGEDAEDEEVNVDE